MTKPLQVYTTSAYSIAYIDTHQDPVLKLNAINKKTLEIFVGKYNHDTSENKNNTQEYFKKNIVNTIPLGTEELLPLRIRNRCQQIIGNSPGDGNVPAETFASDATITALTSELFLQLNNQTNPVQK